MYEYRYTNKYIRIYIHAYIYTHTHTHTCTHACARAHTQPQALDDMAGKGKAQKPGPNKTNGFVCVAVRCSVLQRFAVCCNAL